MRVLALIATTAIALFSTGTEACSGRYNIQAGDTFWGLGTKSGISVNVLLLCNKGQDPTKLQIGQEIKFPQCKGYFPYVVQPGETLTSIGARYNRGLDCMLDCNWDLADPNQISIGQTIRVPNY
ncbi:hypothetical protein MP638_001044 [Amoeboaphelidium occidentale]|nr:hypothetical protein MP638_001044 [Amoeboaphelidium occidentale]